jgi:hypothetical protein
MRDTTFTLSDDHRARLAGLAAFEFEIPQQPEFETGGGGMYGSPSGYLAG